LPQFRQIYRCLPDCLPFLTTLFNPQKLHFFIYHTLDLQLILNVSNILSKVRRKIQFLYPKKLT